MWARAVWFDMPERFEPPYEMIIREGLE